MLTELTGLSWEINHWKAVQKKHHVCSNKYLKTKFTVFPQTNSSSTQCYFINLFFFQEPRLENLGVIHGYSLYIQVNYSSILSQCFSSIFTGTMLVQILIISRLDNCSGLSAGSSLCIIFPSVKELRMIILGENIGV